MARYHFCCTNNNAEKQRLMRKDSWWWCSSTNPWQKPTHCHCATNTAVRRTTSSKNSTYIAAASWPACFCHIYSNHPLTAQCTQNLAAVVLKYCWVSWQQCNLHPRHVTGQCSALHTTDVRVRVTIFLYTVQHSKSLPQLPRPISAWHPDF